MNSYQFQKRKGAQIALAKARRAQELMQAYSHASINQKDK